MYQRIWCLCLLVSAGAILARATTTITTVPKWDGVNVAYNFANDGNGAPIFGQTITVPTNGDIVLASFTFTLLDASSGTIPFKAYVVAWDPVARQPIGSPLYTGSGTTLVMPAGTYKYDNYTFNPNVTLLAGGTYVMYFSAQSSTPAADEPFAVIAHSTGDVYPGGDYVYGVPSNGTIAWYTSVGTDTVFTAVLNPLPNATLPAITGVISAGAFGAFTAAAPGSWIEIYGTGLASGSRPWAEADFSGSEAPTSLDHTTVTIGGQSAFISYISSTQVNAQVPSNVGTGPQQVVVQTAIGASAAVNATMNLEEPGLLSPPQFNIGGTQYVVALFPDGVTYVLPPGAIAGVNSRRAQAGDVITLYGIGFGSVTPASPAGQIVAQKNTLASPFHLLFGGVEASLSYDGLAPSLIGVYQFNVTVPNVTPGNSVPVTFTLANGAGTQKLYIAIQ